MNIKSIFLKFISLFRFTTDAQEADQEPLNNASKNKSIPIPREIEEPKESGQPVIPLPESILDDAFTLLPKIKVDYTHQIYDSKSDFDIAGTRFKEIDEKTSHEGPLETHLYEDLYINYLSENEFISNYVTHATLRKHPVYDQDSIHRKALDSLLDEALIEFQIHGKSNGLMNIKTGSNLEASMILLEEVWDGIHEHLGSKLVVSIPTEDILLICPQSNRKAVKNLKKKAAGFLKDKSVERKLSKAIYQRQAGSHTMTIIGTVY
jgi:hypothetical protein